MSEPIKRRGFLGRMGLATAAAMAGPLQGIADSLKQFSANDKNDGVIKITPLGFQWETADPFLFCVHHEDAFPKGNDDLGPSTPLHGRQLGDDFIIKDGFRMYHGKKVPGFPGHPHRGFETITVVRKGLVDHADSMGASGRYGNGDVQWMTAGKGIQHSEMFPLLNKDKDNPLELFQIWINLPARQKMVEPHYKMLWQEMIPIVKIKDEKGKYCAVELIAGNLNGVKAVPPPPDSWASDPNHYVALWNIKMEAGATWQLPASVKGINRNLYFYEGNNLSINSRIITSYSGVEVMPDRSLNLKAGDEGASILMLQGKPIGEQVIQYGPFVMNTKEEINQAFSDYHSTGFGGWPWPRYDQVHDKNLKRFARHADGKVELKS